MPRILEIGPRDGEDTRRLLRLNPERFTLVDLPDKQARVEAWMRKLDAPSVELIIGNLMYDTKRDALEPYDLVWCAGVLYHNPEQLRMIRKLYDLTRPGGYLVLESATARQRLLRNKNCVEIWWQVDKAIRRRHHVSSNITHLPTRQAIRSWLEMVGFEAVTLSDCHRRVMPGLAMTRAAFIARRPEQGHSGVYYALKGPGYVIGKAR